MKKVLLIASLFPFVFAGQVAVAGDAAAGQTKAAACAACHGMDGNSAAPNFPKLAGQAESYMVKQLQDFKARNRIDPTMNAMAMPLSETDMADIAAYYAGQAGSTGTAAADQVELGETLYRAGNASSGVAACAACHGPTGSGNPQAGFPKVSGQHAQYTELQLNNFRKGARANDAGSMMRVVAGKMTDAEIAAVAQYIQGLR
jgi:cytochrome c553